MPRTLITGGTGFLGSHLCDRLIEEGHEVVCLDNLITGLMDNIAHLIGHEASALSSWTSPSICTSTARWIMYSISPHRPVLSIINASRFRPSRSVPLAPTRPWAWPRLRRPLSAGLDFRGLRRPGDPPPAGGVLGKRESGRPSGGVRRGEAVC